MKKLTEIFTLKTAHLGGENKDDVSITGRPLVALLVAGAVLISTTAFIAGSEYKRHDIQKQIWENTKSQSVNIGTVAHASEPSAILLSNIDFDTISHISGDFDTWKGRQSVSFRRNKEGSYNLYQTAMSYGGQAAVPAQRMVSEKNYSFEEAIFLGAKIETSAAKAKGLENTALFFDRATETFRDGHVVRVAKEFGLFQKAFGEKKPAPAPKI